MLGEVMFVVVFHKLFIIHCLPINSICGKVFLFSCLSILCPVVGPFTIIIYTMRTILKEAEEEHLLWCLLRLTTYLEFVVIPCFSPGCGIFIDGVEKEMV